MLCQLGGKGEDHKPKLFSPNIQNMIGNYCSALLTEKVSSQFNSTVWVKALPIS